MSVIMITAWVTAWLATAAVVVTSENIAVTAQQYKHNNYNNPDP